MKPVTDDLKQKDAEQVQELYNWLKEKQLTTKQALGLLDLIEQAILSARRVEVDNLML